jgi:hypothetical protein
MQGYGHPTYAASLLEIGTPRLLPRAGGWILERSIEGFPYHDAMGCYPVFVCDDWAQLEYDLDQVEGLVCLSLVTDPFGQYEIEGLGRCFPDLVTPFKQHYVIDLHKAPGVFGTTHHRRNVRKALDEMDIEECASPVSFLDHWTLLYRTLTERHGITGMAAFSDETFARQLSVPGLVAFRAVHQGATVGMLLWYSQGNRSYYHLGAYSQRGYELRASFALFDYSIRFFAEREVEWLSLGSGAGVEEADSGLSRFKQGWSTGVRTAYFCGRIFEREKYEEILKSRHLPRRKYFPAYRANEFR